MLARSRRGQPSETAERVRARQRSGRSRAKREMTLELLMSTFVSLRQVLILLCSVASFAALAMAQEQELAPIVSPPPALAPPSAATSATPAPSSAPAATTPKD